MEDPSARHWDELHAVPRYCPRYPDDILVRWCLRSFPERTDRRILDVGCGAGRNALFLAREGFEAHAVDHSKVGVEETARRARDEGLEVHTQICGADEFEARDGFFAGAVCYGVYCYLPVERIARSIERVARALEPGGRFFCMTRTERDWRQQKGVPVGRCRYQLEGLAGTPAAAEDGLEMTLLDEPTLRELFAPFASVELDRRTLTWWDRSYTDDDWLISARR